MPNTISKLSSAQDQGKSLDLPMFYTSLRPLDRDRDRALRISRPSHFGFAANTNAIPLLADEFPLAAAYYPIVFAAGPMPVPAVVVGLCNDTNLFIDANGQWEEGAYLPAYIRRYPFILMDDPEEKRFVLCIDDASDMLAPEGENLLFDETGPSDFTRNAMEFCAALKQQGEATDEFVNALVEHKLLTSIDLKIDTNSAQVQLSGLLGIDPKKFDELPNKVFLKWRSKGWIALIYAHLLSSHRWPNLVALDSRNPNMK